MSENTYCFRCGCEEPCDCPRPSIVKVDKERERAAAIEAAARVVLRMRGAGGIAEESGAAVDALNALERAMEPAR